MKDIFGKALRAYLNRPGDQEIITWTNLTEEDPVPVSYFFRSYQHMPPLEQKALELCRGTILDIGCGSGSHSLYLQENKNGKVIGLDRSKGAIEVAQKRGVEHTICTSILDFSGERFDTLLLLMNGLGIGQTVEGVLPLLVHLKTLLNPTGQILLDSSDLIYLFDEEEHEIWQEDEHYYGEVNYGITYANATEEFPWLYLDFNQLEQIANLAGLSCEKIKEGENFDYLAMLKPMEF